MEDNINMDLNKIRIWECRLDLTGSGYGPVAGLSIW
jgi:hypothetical protein